MNIQEEIQNATLDDCLTKIDVYIQRHLKYFETGQNTINP